MRTRIESVDHAKEIVCRCFCSECGRLRVKTPSGAACEEHRLVLGVTELELSAAEEAKRIIELPILRPIAAFCRRYTLNGKDKYRVDKNGEVEAVRKLKNRIQIVRVKKVK